MSFWSLCVSNLVGYCFGCLSIDDSNCLLVLLFRVKVLLQASIKKDEKKDGSCLVLRKRNHSNRPSFNIIDGAIIEGLAKTTIRKTSATATANLDDQENGEPQPSSRE